MSRSLTAGAIFVLKFSTIFHVLTVPPASIFRSNPPIHQPSPLLFFALFITQFQTRLIYDTTHDITHDSQLTPCALLEHQKHQKLHNQTSSRESVFTTVFSTLQNPDLDTKIETVYFPNPLKPNLLFPFCYSLFPTPLFLLHYSYSLFLLHYSYSTIPTPLFLF